MGFACISAKFQDTAAQRLRSKAKAACSTEIHEEFASGAAWAWPAVTELGAGPRRFAKYQTGSIDPSLPRPEHGRATGAKGDHAT